MKESGRGNGVHLWSDALKLGFRLVLRMRLLLLVPLAFDLAMLAIVVVPPVMSPQFTLPVALPSVAQVRGPGAGGLPFYPLYILAASGDLSTALLLLALVVQSYLAAGYVGRLEMVRRREVQGGFFASANRAFARVLAFLAITTFLVLAASPFLLEGFARGAAALFVFAAVLGLLYFLFLTPFAIVVDNAPLSLAFRASVELAARRFSEVVPYCLGYATITLLTSIGFFLASIGLSRIGWGLAGLFLFPILYSLVGTALVGSTLYLYAGLRPPKPLPASIPEPEAVEDAVPA
ncbi:MAG: hypothetical protein ACE5JE_00780 [Thermoplasmata archaeon]